MGSGKPSEQQTSQPRIVLRQGTVVGIVQDEFAKRQVQSFRGIPYALPPTGDRRFRHPVKVGQSSDIIDATTYGPAAPGKPLIVAGPKVEYSEDCLTANVFCQVPRDGQGLLPVMIYVHGGAFNRGSSSMHNTASMVAWSEQPFIAVSFNYRVGSLGFLPSKLAAKEGILNLGLRDQVLLFEWVQENIVAFRGDKDNVTLAGLSAGAHSIGHHMMRHGESNPGPFHRVIIESGAPTSRAVRNFDAKIHEQQFQDFLHQAGCPRDMADGEVFPFLRSLPLETITNAQNAVFDKYNPSLRWAFQPVIDGDLIPRAPIDTWRANNYCKIPIMTGFNGNEGSLYVNKSMSQGKEFVRFFRTLLPRLSSEDIATIDRIYPDPESNTKDKTYMIPLQMQGTVGAQYRRIEAAYAHYAYVAPVRQTAHLASTEPQSPPVYLYHWAPRTTIIGGASHGDNMRYETMNPDVISVSATQRNLAGTLHSYVTSFICNRGDPNALGVGEWRDRPTWEPYSTTSTTNDNDSKNESKNENDSPKTMIFGRGNEELIGGGVGVTAELEVDDWARDQCEFWWDKVELTQQ